MRYAIPLLGGIGNIIQTMPLMLHLRNTGHHVTAIREAIDYKECENLIRHAYDDIVDKGTNVNVDIGPYIARYNTNTTPEWAGWFETYKIPVPDVIPSGTLYDKKIDFGFDVALCPGHKPNWVMKSYPHWRQLGNELIKRGRRVAIVGLQGDGGPFANNVSDFRGEFNLMQTAAIFRQTKTVIAAEGGLAHLAATNGALTYILIGGTGCAKNMAPANTVPISINMPCQPCQYRGCYIDKSCEPPIWYGCSPDVLIDGSVRCLYNLSPQVVAGRIYGN